MPPSGAPPYPFVCNCSQAESRQIHMTSFLEHWDVCTEVVFENLRAQTLLQKYSDAPIRLIWKLRQDTINIDVRLEPTQVMRLTPDGCDNRGVFRHSEQRRLPHSLILIKWEIRYTQIYIPSMEQEAPLVARGVKQWYGAQIVRGCNQGEQIHSSGIY